MTTDFFASIEMHGKKEILFWCMDCAQSTKMRAALHPDGSVVLECSNHERPKAFLSFYLRADSMKIVLAAIDAAVKAQQQDM